MTEFSGNFTQGGQTQLHKLRMIKQIVGATLWVSLWIFLISFIVLVSLEHLSCDFLFLGAYAKAWLLNMCPAFLADLSPSTVILNRDGSQHIVTNHFLVTDGHVGFMVNTLVFSFLKKGFQALLISLVGSVLVSWFWGNVGKKKQETKILSGFELVDSKILRKRVIKLGASPYDIADVPIPKNAEYQHMMITGTTGSGKSNLIHHLLSQIRAQGDQAIIVDTTGGIFSRFYNEEKDILLNPLDARSRNWNIWDEIINDHVLEDIAESLIPETRSLDTFWVSSSRQLLCESIRFLCNNKLRSYKELLDMTLKMPLKELSQRLQGTSVSAIVDPSIDKTALSVRASLASQLKSLEALEDAKPGQGLSLLNFAKEDQRTWLFLSCQPDQREFVKPLFSAWISLAIKGMMRRSEQNNSRTWIIIDELASLNRLPSLMLGLAEIRKYGGCVMLGFQDLNQLEEIYGPSNTKTLSNLTGTKVLFRNIDTDVSKRIAGFLGEQEKQEATESISFGAHQMRDGVSLGNHKQTKSVITASQIMMLKDLEAYLKFPGDFPTSKVSFDYLDVTCRVPAFVERPTKPSTAKPQAAYPRTVEVESLEPETHGLKLVSSQTQQIQQM